MRYLFLSLCSVCSAGTDRPTEKPGIANHGRSKKHSQCGRRINLSSPEYLACFPGPDEQEANKPAAKGTLSAANSL